MMYAVKLIRNTAHKEFHSYTLLLVIKVRFVILYWFIIFVGKTLTKRQRTKVAGYKMSVLCLIMFYHKWDLNITI
jgi:hypothetical protein